MIALERAARRIGMEWSGHAPDLEPPHWRDPGGDCVAPDDLRTYLLTGDRPLRVMEAYGIGVNPQSLNLCDQKADRWQASHFWGGREWPMHYDTPAAAIIALAERIEGEGRE